MASKTAQAIQRATIERERDERMKRLESQLEKLAQDIARLVELLSQYTAVPDAPRGKR